MSQNANTEFLSDDFDNFIKHESEKLERFSDFSPNQVEIQEPIIDVNPRTANQPLVEKKLSNFHPAPWHSGNVSAKVSEKKVTQAEISESVIDSKITIAAELPLKPSLTENTTKVKYKNLSDLVKLFKLKSESLFKDIIKLFDFNFFGKDKNLLKIFALLTILAIIYNGGKNYLSPDNTASKVQSALIETTGRVMDIDVAYQQLTNYMESHMDSDNFTPKGEFNVKRQPGMLIVTSKTGDCWYFGVVGSKIFEPRLDSTAQKCNLSNF